MRLWSVLLCCVAAGRAGSVWSEDLAAARACVGIADTAARLACYDAAFAAKGAPAATPAASGPSEAQFGDDGQLQAQLKAKADLPKKLQLKVRSVVPLGQGLYRLTLENGQIWETRQADWALEFKSGDTVTISRMIFDSYQITPAGQGGRSVGVKRIE
jgi:hypothetical protein